MRQLTWTVVVNRVPYALCQLLSVPPMIRYSPADSQPCPPDSDCPCSPSNHPSTRCRASPAGQDSYTDSSCDVCAPVRRDWACTAGGASSCGGRSEQRFAWSDRFRAWCRSSWSDRDSRSCCAVGAVAARPASSHAEKLSWSCNDRARWSNLSPGENCVTIMR